jgi:electron transfer flavoprotein-quinone oxidoreductase
VTVFERGGRVAEKVALRSLVRTRQFAEIAPWDDTLGLPVAARGAIRLDSTGSIESSSLDHPPDLRIVDSTDLLRWIADRAIDAGVELVTNVAVTSLISENGQTTGAQTTAGDRFLAECVILADGANSILAEDEGLRQQPAPSARALVAEELISVSAPADACSSYELFDKTAVDISGYGYLIVDRDTVTIGIGAPLDLLTTTGVHVNDMLDRIKQHPRIAPLVEMGTTIRYAARTLPIVATSPRGPFFSGGVIVVGDAAELTKPSFGAELDSAIVSAQCAAEAIQAAAKANDFSVASLSIYRELLDDSGVLTPDTSPFHDEREYLQRQFERLKHPASV